MLRPRESRDLRLISSQLAVATPGRALTWAHDVFGNAVATATFPFLSPSSGHRQPGDGLELHAAMAWPVFEVAVYRRCPIRSSIRMTTGSISAP